MIVSDFTCGSYPVGYNNCHTRKTETCVLQTSSAVSAAIKQGEKQANKIIVDKNILINGYINEC